VSKEKPYLYVDDAGSWNVFVPAARQDSSSATWIEQSTPGASIPLSQFYLAHPGDLVTDINAALEAGLHLLLTPGVYDLAEPITVTRADRVVLGMGLATLTATHGDAALTTSDVPGIDIAGVTIDAGPVNSPVLVKIGTTADCSTSDGLTALQDVFFRIGGPHVGKADVALEINRDKVLLDDLWIWRADHGVDGSVGWDVNTSDTGLVINGDNVTALGLFVEHFQKQNVIWNGDGGQVIFFQNELPYDPPNQAAYMNGDEPGYPAFEVAETVTSFTGWGMGSYIYTNVDPTIHVANAFKVPTSPGVVMNSLVTINLSGPGTIDHVINSVGTPVDSSVSGQASQVVRYPTEVGEAPLVPELPSCDGPASPTPTVTPSTSATPTAPAASATPAAGLSADTGGTTSPIPTGHVAILALALGLALAWVARRLPRV
jgi:hypothetical protein